MPLPRYVSAGASTSRLTTAKSENALIRVLRRKHDRESLRDDLEIKPDRPFANILVVKNNSLFHFVESFCFAAATVYLSQSRDPRFDFMTKHIAFDLASIKLIMGNGTSAGDSFINLNITPQGQASSVMIRKLA